MKDFINYATTCYIDKDYELAGILEIDEKTYIDFDRKTVYINQEDQGLSSTKMAILEKLIIESPRVVAYESLYRTYYDSRYYDTEPDIQVLRNVISALNKFVRITNVSKSGYKIELPKSIKRFGSIRKSEVTDISELFSAFAYGITEEEYTEIECAEEGTLAFSEKFFNSGAQELSLKDGNAVIAELSRLSEVFNCITAFDGNSLRSDVIGDAYKVIVEGCKSSDANEILKIKGPLILNEVNQRKTTIIWYHLHVASNK